jgi:hypothetical protein
MATILYAWEFGANLGHVGTFLPVARELRKRGTTVCWAVARPNQAARLLPDAGFDWMQAPQIPEQRRDGPPLNYADILLRFGYRQRTSICLDWSSPGANYCVSPDPAQCWQTMRRPRSSPHARWTCR